MKNIIITVLMLMLPSLAMAQGQVTRKPKPDPVKPTHTHSVNGPKNCRECNRLRRHTHSISGPEWCVECNRQREEERQRVAKQRRREEELRLAEERKRKEKEEAKLAEQKRKEEERLAEERKRKAAEERKLAEKKCIIDNIVNNMVYVEGGTFMMGGNSIKDVPKSQLETSFGLKLYNVNCEKPIHEVTLSSFSIGKYEVSQLEWEAIMGFNPSEHKGDNLPVECVSWDDCQTFIRKLNSLTGKNFRLPTEAEWEFAARGGNNSHGYKYAGSNDIDSVAWYDGNSGHKTHPVGQKSPNELGIYDMSGNVLEWCWDWHGFNYYSYSPKINPLGPVKEKSSLGNVIRGGHCSYYSWASCVTNRGDASRNHRYKYIGFRLAM